MKKTAITTAFLFAIGCTAALATEESYASQIQTFHNQTFHNQTLQSRQSESRAPKILPSDSTANTRNILSTQLPTTLRKDLKKEYKDYWISELYEQGSNKHPIYYITIENADQVVKMDATGSKNWTIQSTAIKQL